MLAQSPDNVFNSGNELYRAGKYQEAAKEYESIIKQGKSSAELSFNLGNAYYRDSQLARAILSYERAARLHPNDPDIEHNLKLAYLKTVDRIEAVPDMFLIQWLRAVGSLMSSEIVRVIFIFSWVLLFGSLGTMFIGSTSGSSSCNAYSVFYCNCVGNALRCYVRYSIISGYSQDKAIITAQTVTAKSSPDAKAVDAFVIHEGVKVKLTDAVSEWVKVTLADGKIGWIPADQCERI